MDNYNDKENTQNKIDTWTREQLHGKHPYIMINEDISKQDTCTWLKIGNIYPETVPACNPRPGNRYQELPQAYNKGHKHTRR